MIPQAPIDTLTGIEAARLGVYVHFPYCLSKCPYCDFASIAAKQVPEERYARAVLAESAMRMDRAPPSGREVDSIYFGGGTPSLWSARFVGAVLDAIATRLTVSPRAEITLEANPGAADAARFADFRRVGINRISIGVQSFQPQTLAALGREHSPEDAERAFAAARSAGFENVSMDFIFGVHGQTLEQARADARRAAALEPEHLSAYALTLEKEALAEEVPLAKQLARGEVSLPPDEVVASMGEAVREAFAAKGLARYEISNFARPGFHSRHNALYWTGGEYLALGSGATGARREGNCLIRSFSPRSAEQYFLAVESGRLPEALREVLEPDERFSERVAMGLRLTSGIDLRAVCAEFSQPFDARRSFAATLARDGFATFDGARLALTERGADVHSAICAKLI